MMRAAPVPRRVCVGALVLALALIAPTALADAPHRARQTPPLRHETAVVLRQAQSAAEAGNLEQALRVLDGLRADTASPRPLNAYERANLHNLRALISERLNRIPAAIESYEAVLRQPELPESMELGTRYRLAELYLAREDFPRAADQLQAWLALSPLPTPVARLMLAQAEYGLSQYRPALANLESAIAQATRQGQPPQESWYLLARALHHAMGNARGTAAALETLARHWPRKEYFVQLSGVYGELGDRQRQLAAMHALYAGGWLATERELLNMAYLYLDTGLPLQAARLLDSALREGRVAQSAANVELAGIAWLRARESERAMPELERAAVLANSAEAWARLAGIELAEERHEQAADAARKSMALGGGTHADSTRVLLGVALYNLGRLDDASAVFAEAKRDERSAVIAEQWLRFIDGERKRAAEFAPS